jgi:hypothetical protein
MIREKKNIFKLNKNSFLTLINFFSEKKVKKPPLLAKEEPIDTNLVFIFLM